MPAAYDSLRALSRQTMKGLLNVPGWQKFLAFASRSFKLPFPAQVLAYAQRPDASVLMKSSEWDVYGRPVKKGSQGGVSKQTLKGNQQVKREAKSEDVGLEDVPFAHQSDYKREQKRSKQPEDSPAFWENTCSSGPAWGYNGADQH